MARSRAFTGRDHRKDAPAGQWHCGPTCGRRADRRRVMPSSAGGAEISSAPLEAGAVVSLFEAPRMIAVSEQDRPDTITAWGLSA
jgi:hypothetical protein